MITAFLQLSQDPLIDKVAGVVIAVLFTQAVLSALGAVGFVAISKRFMDKEVPAELTRLNTGMDRLGTKVDDLAKALIVMQQQQSLQEYRINRLENEKREHDPLDDTRGGSRQPGRTRPR